MSVLVRFPTCPSFEVWLLAERRRLAAATQNVLHEAALAKRSSTRSVAGTARAPRFSTRRSASRTRDQGLTSPRRQARMLVPAVAYAAFGLFAILVLLSFRDAPGTDTRWLLIDVAVLASVVPTGVYGSWGARHAPEGESGRAVRPVSAR